MGRIHIGTAGWSIPRQVAGDFPSDSSALARYASHFPVVEINSSFHRPHRLDTWERWRDSTPSEFRFSVKLPKVITHERKLADFEEPLAHFLAQAETLGEKLAVLLVQLPPKLAFDKQLATPFFAALAAKTSSAVVCEPRNPSWFGDDAERLLIAHRVARVAADPAICEEACRPGGWCGSAYWRLHGSPRMYRSSYADRLTHYAAQIEAYASTGGEAWCIFDNTASSAATSDALALMRVVAAPRPRVVRA